MPITWRNVTGPDFAAGNNLLVQGQQGVTQGLGQLAGVADQQVKTNKEDLALDKTKNTESVLGRIARLSNMDDYKSAVNDGTFDPNNLPTNVDTAAIRTALQSKDNKIMQQSADDFKYQQQVDTQNDNPLLTEFNKTLLQTKGDGYNDLVAGLDKSGLSETGQLKAMQAVKQQKTGEEALRVANLKTQRAEKANLRNDTLQTKADAKTLAKEANVVADKVVNEDAAFSTKSANNLYAGIVEQFPYTNMTAPLDASVTSGTVIDSFIDTSGKRTPIDSEGVTSIKGQISDALGDKGNGFTVEIPNIDYKTGKKGKPTSQKVDLGNLDPRILKASLGEIGVDERFVDSWTDATIDTNKFMDAVKRNTKKFYVEQANRDYVKSQEIVRDDNIRKINIKQTSDIEANLKRMLRK